MQITALMLKIWPKRWVATVLVVLCILYLTLVPRPLPDNNIDIPGLDKVVHAIMFGGLAFVACIDLSRRSRRRFVPLAPRALLLVGTSVTIFGGAIEIAQEAMDMGRGGDILDFAADVAGIVAGVFLANKMIRSHGNQTTVAGVKKTD